ncbi:MAG TPA: methyltransferase domain-containing protein, partial [Caldilineaceae bacterium]|nr:methyltransferase domain-containing protein [Caldilineaceae bacterium]
MTNYARAHDMDSWLRDPRIATRGFAHRWRSSVAAGNGEDAFIALLEQHLRPDSDVLDLGCGHGELTLTLAARCRTIVGIEREAGYLELAKELAAEQKVTNVQFFLVNLAGGGDQERPFAGIPLADESIDLFVNRRGPLLRRYLAEARRVARRGAVIVGLHPTGNI